MFFLYLWSLHFAGVGQHEGYFERFSPFFLPHALHLVFPSVVLHVLQSTQPPSLPEGPWRLNHLFRDSSSFKTAKSS
jgi:hypothetical protein